MAEYIALEIQDSIATISLNDPQRRNAMSSSMFASLHAAIQRIAAEDRVKVVLLRGEGSVFCAGFDLAAAAEQPTLISDFILQLAECIRRFRQMPIPVVAAVQGAAIAGGCALVTACDFVVADRDATFGYPVHRIGVSPAVTIPTLSQMIGVGAARTLLMSGDLLTAIEAHRLGLVTHLSESPRTVLNDAQAICDQLCTKGAHALRITKGWINELDGSLNDHRSARPAKASADLAVTDESVRRLKLWKQPR